MQVATICQVAGNAQNISLAFQNGCSIVQKIYQFAQQHISLIQNLVLCAFGAKEVCFDFTSSKEQHEKYKTTSDKVDHIAKILEIETGFTLVHGALYLGSGLSGLLAEIFTGIAVPIFQNIGAGLFLIVNMYSLEQNIERYYYAQKLADEGIHPKIANRIRISAAMGIINNIGYILSTIFLLIPGAFYVGVALGIFAFFVGTIKIIIDCFCLNPELEKIIPKD